MENPSDIWSLIKIWSGMPNFDILERCFLSSVLNSSSSISEPKKWSEEIASEPQKSEHVNMDHVGSIIFVDPCATTNHNTLKQQSTTQKNKHRDGGVLHSDSTLAMLFLKGRGTYQIGPLWSSDDFALKPTVRGSDCSTQAKFCEIWWWQAITFKYIQYHSNHTELTRA